MNRTLLYSKKGDLFRFERSAWPITGLNVRKDSNPDDWPVEDLAKGKCGTKAGPVEKCSTAARHS